jgi:3-hydroxyisobutyrate dehydrogenase
MASRLCDAGFELSVFDLDFQRLKKFAKEHGCKEAASLVEVGENTGIVITMLPDAGTVRLVVLGDGMKPGLSNSMKPGTILIDMSSSSPGATRELGAELHPIGIALVDAPVSGGVAKARTGTLAIMAGGDQAVVERCMAVFKSLGDKVFHTGQLGTGHAVKALNNMCSAAGLIAAAEVLLVGQKFGLTPHVMLQVLNSSTGRNHSTENKFENFIISRSFDSGFSLDLMLKDLTTAVEMARNTQTPFIFSSLCRELWAAAQAGLGRDLDHTEVVRWFEEMSNAVLLKEDE